VAVLSLLSVKDRVKCPQKNNAATITDGACWVVVFGLLTRWRASILFTQSDLHEYQNKAVDFIKSRKRCMLLLDMGLGKTASALSAASDLIDGCVVKRVLVIAPLRVADSVWEQESQKWRHLCHLSVSVCTGTERKRISALQRTADVYVINRENVPWLVRHYAHAWPFDAIVVDESSSFKNSSAQRWRALKKILPQTEYMVLLTGTPSPNSLLDLWAQMYLVDFGQRLGRTFTGYKQRFFEQGCYMGYKWSIKARAAEHIHNLVADVCLSMSAEDYLELPPRIMLNEFVDLPPATLANYRSFEKQLLATLPSGEEVEALNAAVLANKLLQWCNGATYTDAVGNWTPIHSAKLEALKELVENNDEPLLVAYNYRIDFMRIVALFPDAVKLDKDPETINRWNRGEIKMLLAHPASAGHGLNLQDGGSLCVWFGLTWSLELYQQFNARLHRQGQSKPVRIVHIVARGCIDERVLRVLSSKDASQRDLLRALKA
jgi:SNF2 family DNA or RNA helicase